MHAGYSPFTCKISARFTPMARTFTRTWSGPGSGCCVMTDPLWYPFDQAPEPGQRREVAPGVHWLNFPLPFALDHINLWLLEDGDGWTLVDTGFSSRHTQEIWRTAFQDALGGRPIHRIIVTH